MWCSSSDHQTQRITEEQQWRASKSNTINIISFNRPTGAQFAVCIMISSVISERLLCQSSTESSESRHCIRALISANFAQILCSKEIPAFFICDKVAALKRLMSEPRTLGWSTATLWSSLLFRHTWEFILYPESASHDGSKHESHSAVRLGNLKKKIYIAPLVVCRISPYALWYFTLPCTHGCPEQHK